MTLHFNVNLIKIALSTFSLSWIRGSLDSRVNYYDPGTISFRWFIHGNLPVYAYVIFFGNIMMLSFSTCLDSSHQTVRMLLGAVP